MLDTYDNPTQKKVYQKSLARKAGWAYLVLAITGTFNFIIKGKLYIFSDPRLTSDKILSAKTLFMFNLTCEAIMSTSWLFIAIFLYTLFKNIKKTYALIMLQLVVVGSSVIYLTILFQLSGYLIFNNSSEYLTAFDPQMNSAMGMLFLDSAKNSVYLNYLTMGLWLFPFAYFVFFSGLFPKRIGRIWGTLLILGGVGYLWDFFTYFIFSGDFTGLTRWVFAGDLFSIFWLIIKGTGAESNILDKPETYN